MELDLKQLDAEKLLKHPIINRAELARELFPNSDYAPNILATKMRKRGYRRVTEKDVDAIRQALERFLQSIGVVKI